MSERETQKSAAVESVDEEHASKYLTSPSLTVILAVCLIVFAIANDAASSDYIHDAGFWLPLIQVVAGIGITLSCGAPSSRREWLIVISAHAVMLAIHVLILTGTYRLTEVLFLEAFYRLVIVCLWLFPVAGILLVIETLRRRRLRWRDWVPRAIRLCLAATLVLITVEATALVIERQRRPRPLRLDLPKAPESEWHIATIGGSTMLGFPYDPEWGIGRVAVQQLMPRFPDRKFVLHNLAQTGINLELAVSSISDLTVRPDVLVIYSGHNEFFHGLEQLQQLRATAWPKIDGTLNWSPAFRIINGAMAARSSRALRHPYEVFFASVGCPEHVKARRLQQYSDQLRTVFEWAMAGDVTVVFCVPTSDEATFRPTKSVVPADDEETRKWAMDRWRHVNDLESQERWEEALKVCENVLNSVPNCAEFHFIAGRCCRILGRLDDARRHFHAAREFDDFPIRARDSYATAGAALAARYGVAVVNCPKILRQQTDDEILDDRFFLDGVHPNLKTYFLLGTAVAEAVSDSLRANAADRTESRTELSFQECIARLNVTAETLTRAYTTTGNVIAHYNRLRRLDDEARTAAGERFLKMAEQLKDGTIRPGEGGTESLTQMK